jgi:general secretion pathway protein J
VNLLSVQRSAQQGFTSSQRSAENGFTLIELLIALLIFGMLASAGVALLSFSVRAQAATMARLTATANERRISALLSTDLAQVVPRISRDVSGNAEAAFDGGKGAVLMSYVRSGWSNSGGAARSGLQRVEWRLVQGRLERITRPIVDGAINAKPIIMAQNVESARVRFRLKGEWRDDWSATNPRALPRAVELIITSSGSAPITRKFLVGTGY